MTPEQKQQLPMAIAIVIAGAFIAVAVYLSGGQSPSGPSGNNQGAGFENNNSGAASTIRAVDENDHIFGNPDAPVTIVEYSDYECPFCARFHPTVARIVEEFDGQVRWVYRNFPLNSIHPQADPAARAAECVARLAGNDAFWQFGNLLFNNQSSLGTALYEQGAAQFGVSSSDLASCMQSAEVIARVNQDLAEATTAGGRGTPFSIIISPDGSHFPFDGALPYEQVKPLVEQALAN